MPKQASVRTRRVRGGLGLRMGNMSSLIFKHAGEFAATNGRGIIFAIASTPEEAERKAREKGLRVPILFRIPDHACRHFFAL